MPEATDETHACAPWWLEVPLMVVAVLVATVAGAGLILGISGEFHTALAYAFGVPIAVGLIVWARPWRGRVAAPRGVALPAIGAIAVSVAFFAVASHQPAQHVTIDRDPGSYTSTALMLSNTGALEADPPPAALRDLPHAQTASAAAYDVGGGRLNFQFNHLTSVIAAVALDTIGVQAMFRVGALFGAVALLSVYCVAVRATRRPMVALIAPALFAVIAPLLYVSRDTFSESSTLLFLWTGLLVLCRLCERPSAATGAIVGLLVGATAMARLEALLYLALLFGGLGLLVACASTPSEKRARLRASLVAIGAAIVVAVIGFVDLNSRSWLYLQALWSDYRTGLLLCAAALVVGVALLLIFRRPERREVARRWGRRAAVPAGGLVGVLFAGFWFVRPHLHATHWSMNIGLIGRLQSEERQSVDPTRNYAEHSFLWMVWFLGVPSIVAAIGGAIVLTVDALRARANAATLGVLVLLLGTGPLYWWRPSIVPDLLWATRRYIPAVYPALVLAGVVAVAWLVGRIDQRAVRVVIGGACAAAMVVPPLLTTLPVWRQHEQYDFSAPVTDACGALDDNAAVVLVGTPDWVFLPQTIRAWCDVPVVSIGDPKNLTAARLDQLSHDLAAEGYKLYVVGMNPKNLMAAGADLTNAVTTSLALNTNSAEQTLTHPPDSYLNQRLQLTVVPVG